MTTYFTSDTHFGHGGSLGIFRRPFGSVTEMNETMIERWNALVAPDDEVWHLGDLALQIPTDKVAELLARLNGVKHLVAGNNDKPAVLALSGWVSVQHYAELEIGGRFLVLCHYPFRSWNRMHKGALNLHGHSHGGLPPPTASDRRRDGCMGFPAGHTRRNPAFPPTAAKSGKAGRARRVMLAFHQETITGRLPLGPWEG